MYIFFLSCRDLNLEIRPDQGMPIKSLQYKHMSTILLICLPGFLSQPFPHNLIVFHAQPPYLDNSEKIRWLSNQCLHYDSIRI